MRKKNFMVGTSTLLIFLNMSTATTFASNMKEEDVKKQSYQSNNMKNNLKKSSAKVTISRVNDRKIDVKYSYINKYDEKIKLFLEDWALYPKNHKEYLGELGIGKEYMLNKTFNIVPSFDSDGGLSSENTDLDFNDSKKDTIYINNKIVGFSPTFYVKDINGLLLSTDNTTATIDMESLINSMQKLSKSVKIKATIPNKGVKVGDKIDIEYEIYNGSNEEFNVKVQDGIYFGAGNESELGKVLPGQVTKFKKVITVNKDLIGADSKLRKGLPAFHFYDGNGEAFVQKANMEYVSEVVNSSFKGNMKLAYLRSYGVVMEGNVTNDLNEKFDKNVKKKLVVKSNDQTNVKEFNVANTDWYEKNNFSGYQAILTSKDISSLGNIKDAQIYIQFEFKDKLIEIPITSIDKRKKRSSESDYSWASDYFYDLRNMPETEIGNSKFKVGLSNDGNVVVSNTIRDGALNMLSYYVNSNRDYVYDGAFSPKLSSDKYKKAFEVKKNGTTVYSGNVVKFADGVYPEVPNGSAIQVIVPEKFSTPEYTVNIVVKDSSGKTVEEFTIPKYFK